MSKKTIQISGEIATETTKAIILLLNEEITKNYQYTEKLNFEEIKQKNSKIKPFFCYNKFVKE